MDIDEKPSSPSNDAKNGPPTDAPAEISKSTETATGASAVRSIEGWIVLVTNVHEEASEEDINAELEKMSEQFKMDAEQIKSVLGGTTVLEHDVKIRKTVEFLVENAKVTE